MKRKIPLNGKEWIKRSISIWQIPWTKEEREIKRMVHPAIFPEELARRFIEVYCPPEGWVIDPFMGSGTTLIAARKMDRNVTGYDVDSEYFHFAYNRVGELFIPDKYELETLRAKDGSATDAIMKDERSRVELHLADARELSKEWYRLEDRYDLCFTSPPYWNIHYQKRTANGKASRKYYKDEDADIGHYERYEIFINQLKELVFSPLHRIVKPGGHCIIICMDLRKKVTFYPLHMDIAETMKSIGWQFEDIIVWDRRQDYNNLRPLGYPYVFRVNKVHEYCLIFKRWSPT